MSAIFVLLLAGRANQRHKQTKPNDKLILNMKLINAKFTALIACAVAMFSLNGVAQEAQNEQFFSKGDWVVGLNGSYNWINAEYGKASESASVALLQAEGNYFVTDAISVGVNTMWMYLPEVEGVKAYAYGLESNVRYNHQVNQHMVAYVGANLGYAYGKVDVPARRAAKNLGYGYAYGKVDVGGDSLDDSLSTYGLHAGFVVPINENIFFDTQLKWTCYDLPVDGLDLDTVQVLFGLKIKL